MRPSVRLATLVVCALLGMGAVAVVAAQPVAWVGGSPAAAAAAAAPSAALCGATGLTPQSTLNMPLLEGEAARSYLEEQGLYISLAAAIAGARYSVNPLALAAVPAYVGGDASATYTAQNAAQHMVAY